MARKKKAATGKANAANAPAKAKPPGRAAKAAEKQAAKDRRAHKLAVRRQKQPDRYAGMWDGPAPAHLVAKLDVPRVKSKYQSYFEFAPNPEKQDKKLEYQVTNDKHPPPGFVFVPIGHPKLTKMCKDLSREMGAMIFIVSSAKEKEQLSRISDHIHRTGYHFRETIVDQAREIVGETEVSQPVYPHGAKDIEPIPESQEEIYKQADNAILDLFPRIPNTDRWSILEHAFRKGATFRGEPTVGLQPGLSLSRRVQLAVLAHIRHNHTRYDKLLRETSWVNARKAVEPVCMDFIVKWRSDEETGRDQLDEILREVVIITDSEDEDDSSDDDESSDEEGEVTSASSTEPISQSTVHTQQRLQEPVQQAGRMVDLTGEDTEDEDLDAAISSRTRSKRDKRAQRGFKRYQAAWDEAKHRQQDPSHFAARAHSITPLEEAMPSRPLSTFASPLQGVQRPVYESRSMLSTHPASDYHRQDRQRRYVDLTNPPRSALYHSHHGSTPGPSTPRNEVISKPQDERAVYYQDIPSRIGTAPYPARVETTPQVVRGSSAAHVLQDLLVPSVEAGISDISFSALKEPIRVRDSVNHSQDLGPRRVMEQSPAPRPQAILNDDSPQIKRRRLIHEDDAGHFRPLPSRDFSLSTHPDSHLTSASCARSGEFLVQHPRVSSQSTQGLFRDNQPTYVIDPATSERLPVYDAPEYGYFKPHAGYSTRLDDEFSGQQRGLGMRQVGSHQPSRDHVMKPFSSLSGVPGHKSTPAFVASDRVYSQRPKDVQDGSGTLEAMRRDWHSRQVEQDHSRRNDVPRPLSPEFPVSRTTSHSYGASIVVPEQDSVHSFSQSQLGGPVSLARDGSAVLAERPPQSFVGYGHQREHPNDAEHAARLSYATIPPLVRASSPVRYVERPVSDLRHYHGDQQQPQYYEHSVSHPGERYIPDERRYVPHERLEPYGRERQLPQGDPPTYVRTLEPRRQVVVLE